MTYLSRVAGHILGFALLPLILAAPPASAGISSCPGDCNGDQIVTVDELVRGVNIALDQQTIDSCPAFDRNSDGQVTIDELLAAVSAAIGTCPAAPTPTATGTTGEATSTPEATALARSSPRPPRRVPPPAPAAPSPHRRRPRDRRAERDRRADADPGGDGHRAADPDADHHSVGDDQRPHRRHRWWRGAPRLDQSRSERWLHAGPGVAAPQRAGRWTGGSAGHAGLPRQLGDDHASADRPAAERARADPCLSLRRLPLHVVGRLRQHAGHGNPDADPARGAPRRRLRSPLAARLGGRLLGRDAARHGRRPDSSPTGGRAASPTATSPPRASSTTPGGPSRSPSARPSTSSAFPSAASSRASSAATSPPPS